MSPSRRSFLATAACGVSISSAGCTDLSHSIRERRLGPPERTVPVDWVPEPGTWPLPAYDAGRSATNPHAEPPRSPPRASWSWDADGRISSLVVVDGTVYAAVDETVVALDPNDGTETWSRTVETYGSGLAAIADRLYSFGGGVTALTLDGELAWTTRLDLFTHGFLERDGWLFVGDVSGEFRRLHADTGDVVEAKTLEGALAGVATDGDLLYGVGRRELYAYAVTDGQLDRHFEIDADDHGASAHDHLLSPAVADGRVYLARQLERDGIDDGVVAVHDGTSGDRLDQVEFTPRPRHPVVDDETVFVTASVGELAELFRLDEGDVTWRYEPDGPEGLRSPISTGETVLVHATNHDRPVIAFDAESGEELWRRDIDADGPLIAVDDVVYVGTRDGIATLRADG
ncbi:outer membrane protein assembly factor BamB family protein [Natrarchaeobaculum sulfurireducens]|nr:PQQ-binding-like beta-propeller repeat protein [Natrarchaeobaculum sulfurireducens]